MSWTMMVMRAGQVRKTNKKSLHSGYYTLICKEHVDSIGSEISPLIWNVLKTVPLKKVLFLPSFLHGALVLLPLILSLLSPNLLLCWSPLVGSK